MIGQAGIDLAIESEVSSKTIYEKTYHRPEWPGEQSGITVGIGYDLGQASVAKIKRDWESKVSAEMLTVMTSCSGLTGLKAKPYLAVVKNKIDIPWDVAVAVFMNNDVPEYTNMVLKAIPSAARLSADCLGVLFDLVYNRGASFSMTGDRYKEMRAIKAHIESGNLAAVATDLREMERLWPNSRGLRLRREAEAKLWLAGLSNPVAATKIEAKEAPPPALAAPPRTDAHATAIVIAAAGAETTHQAVAAGWTGTEIGLIAAASAVVVVAVWFAVKQIRTPDPTTARGKDFPVAPAT